MSSRRLVKTAVTCPSASMYRGTSTAASMRPCTSRDAASAASSSTSRRRCASSSRFTASAGHRDALDALLEHALAIEHPVDGALGGDDLEALDLLLGEVLGHLQ